MKYTLFIFSILYVCLLLSRSAQASERLNYRLESCNNGLTAKNPIESQLGESMAVTLQETGVEILPKNSFPISLNNASAEVFEVPSSKISYQSQALSPTQYQVDVKEQGDDLNKDFGRSLDKNHKLQITMQDGEIVVEWTQVDQQWDNYFSCTYKVEVITAKN